MKHVVIIGNGVAGITAARNIRKLSDYRISVISSETEYFFSRPAIMYIYMGHMNYEHTKPYEDWFWKKNKINLVRAWVERVDFGLKQVHFSGGGSMQYDILILATGSQSNMFDWPGKELEGVSGMVSIQDLAKIERYTQGCRHAVVVGGGLIGIELCEMLRSRNIGVTYLVREFKFWQKVLPSEEADMVDDHIREHGVDLRLATELKEIIGDGNGRVKAVITDKGDKVECGFVGICAGVHPAIDFLKESGLNLRKGIMVNEYLETNHPNVYAIGDCAEFVPALPGRPAIEQIWYTGRMHGETVAMIVCGKRIPYRPQNFFNSAKLFDIEYQIYSRHFTFSDQDLDSVLWMGDDRKKAIRIYWNKNDGAVSSFSLLGVRYRQKICDQWISERAHINHVMEQLSLANFDPEFHTQYEKKVLGIYNRKTGKNLKLKARKGLAAST